MLRKHAAAGVLNGLMSLRGFDKFLYIPSLSPEELQKNWHMHLRLCVSLFRIAIIDFDLLTSLPYHTHNKKQQCAQ